MAQFRGIVQGQQGTASRLGSKKSGLWATVNGWDSGILVEASHKDGKDVFTIWRTSGSNGSNYVEQIATV